MRVDLITTPATLGRKNTARIWKDKYEYRVQFDYKPSNEFLDSVRGDFTWNGDHWRAPVNNFSYAAIEGLVFRLFNHGWRST